MFNLPTDAAVHSIETLLYSISTILYLPVLLGIAALVLHMLVCFGTFGAEWLERRRGVRVLVATAKQEMAAVLTAQEGEPGLDARLERLVQRADANGVRRLDAVRFVVRVGPALGLMGTLIPMGISLAGLAQGNLPKMAESMTTAFTATVVGLACSVSAYVLSLVREHWLRTDLTEIAYVAESHLAAQDHKPHLVRAGA
ncbi:MotA/TolQ/ExbB proton channel family [Janthinobacterium sp. HH01]|uniref:MotA/TolQ/ExbB proton channel family protein n=1 Tax=Janthinobacterium sp. HH01 TaxID=1198452 RepID=UPI0002AEDD46|nr:MotA/TolQ/ExbB proton channel family protein [Janthinobacterium sp. HH01]ELX10047.1 MotA/TolQ/ExbB proton channel family [Janthinobacterium sp. HH01]